MMSCYFIHTRQAKIRKINNSECWQDCEGKTVKDGSALLVGMYDVRLRRESARQVPEILNIELPQDHDSIPRYMPERNANRCTHTHIHMLTAHYSQEPKSRNKPNVRQLTNG